MNNLSAGNSHTCYAIGCGKLIRKHLLMCPKHWSMVPRHIQDEVNKWYRADNAKWLAAIREARSTVEMLEVLEK